MLKNNLGYPRVGDNRQLKKACERYWAGTISTDELHQTAWKLRETSLKLQQEAGIDLIPCNDFSFYDHILDMSLMLGVIPKRYSPILTAVKGNAEIDLYFAMARGYQKDGLDIPAMEMTKWFDTNYHFIVPEFTVDQEFKLFSEKAFAEFNSAKQILGSSPKPVLTGPVTYLLLGKEKSDQEGNRVTFNRIDLIKKLVPVYVEIINTFKSYGAEWIQLDEPYLSLDLSEPEKQAFQYAYGEISKKCNGIKILLTSYFESLGDNTVLALHLPVAAVHIDLVRGAEQLNEVLKHTPPTMNLSLGVVDGRNIWKNDYLKSLYHIQKAVAVLGSERIMVAASCSLLHSPCDLDLETTLNPVIKNWMAFARQKLDEISDLYEIANGNNALLSANILALESRKSSSLIHRKDVRERLDAISEKDATRKSLFSVRQQIQKKRFNLPLFPTTTIGSFPQTADIRQLRAKLKKGNISLADYDLAIEIATLESIRWQEEIDIDVLVHGEFERNDMVEYFGEMLQGFVFTRNGWVQSYGSRCVKPPVIFGDIKREKDLTVRWSKFAQEHTSKPMKGMLTGPITILQWSFVRNDQPRSETAFQLALAIRDEVLALEKAGIGIIQIDEPAIREGLPLRKNQWATYLDWAIKAFRISASGVKDETQIHTHMCYSEFNDIIKNIAEMDADVITIETSRSQMELLDAFIDFNYPNEIGPGVYDIHSPRIPSVQEMVQLLEKAAISIPIRNLWVNPDCGLKTRNWPETKQALLNMVQAAKQMREKALTPLERSI
ncbi:5-methyltetrahydropteroyltriglutamate--homocysteine S-methyltransferase [Arcticibacter eurypsychrophilus]|uniref:5-methyltetrahydropteroyltriglutamate-- homocysteine S-methyltransferase n=1 Tax=Arcticibacter eurypsychrophilus TaxID=1434752 RepID=UPI00084D626A|nr:5-methyltetrahydropteroyltriglutamate--homocysteine S-methyltransferase [Arcticibacter eurypsychrophilus]